MKSFNEQVYDIVARIPAGRVATFGQNARMIGRPRMARFVGYASNNKNSWHLPWHRVVFKDGSLCGAGFFEQQYKALKSTGPIPEGTYVARQEKLQFMSATDWLVGWTTKVTDSGAWPGSSMSWGSSRVWLEPAKETNTYGRDNFSIHGGWAPGSAGCIDMTSNIKNFVALFEFVGKDLIVEVKY